MYLLRRHLGIGALEARHVLPAWEIEVLLDELARDQADGQTTGDTGPAPSEGALTMTGEVD